MKKVTRQKTIVQNYNVYIVLDAKGKDILKRK